MGMRIHDGDSVFVGNDRDRVGIVQRRVGTNLRVRLRDDGMEEVPRSQVQPVAQKIADAVSKGTKYSNALSYRGDSRLGELAVSFGYGQETRLRGDTLTKIKNQLARAGLQVISDGESADTYFELQELAEILPAVAPGPSKKTQDAEASFEIPSLFWPQALGLAQSELLRFLRALPEPDPLLCLLYLPEGKERQTWLQPTWEGLVGWAYKSAQRFVRRPEPDGDRSRVVRLPATVLDRYSKGSPLPDDARLHDGFRYANLITLESEADERGFARLKATWPGSVFEFRPLLENGEGDEALRALSRVIYAVGGRPDGPEIADIKKISPLDLLVWARNTVPKLLAAAAMDFGDLVSSQKIEKFRGSNEGSTALALKALAATWGQKQQKNRSFGVSFEEKNDTTILEEDEIADARRVDVSIRGMGVFEVETLAGSGPIEDFYHRKVFSRLDLTKKLFHLVVPSDAILWAGPYLADIAHLLGARGRVLVPTGDSTEDGDTNLGLIAIAPARLERASVEVEEPTAVAVSGSTNKIDEEKPIKLGDIAGYEEVISLIRDEVIWTRTNTVMAKAASCAAGILFYGPPGCGKSRIARAICGELGHEVRLRGPANFKGIYIGWGQHLVREEFEWLLEDEKRVLLIDEFDAIARSRREVQMHSDEKADVNELLVQLDRASRLGRLVLCTTNFVSSIDEAVVRSGRFSHFVPVGPPDVKAAEAIVTYYLDNLGFDAHRRKIEKLEVIVPSRSAVQSLLTETCGTQAKESPWLSGTDLEEAVARAFRMVARDATKYRDGRSLELPEMITSDHPGDPLRVEITVDHLRKALKDARRSITWASLQTFLEEIGAHSPSQADAIESRLFDRE